MAQNLYNMLFCHELSEAELACLLIVFNITAMSKQSTDINKEEEI